MNGEIVKDIFAGWNETIIWSCLQRVMGHLYADDSFKPVSAMALLGDFCFFAGKPDTELAAFKPEWTGQDFIIAVPQNHQWAEVIEKQYGNKAKKVMRYAMKKEPDIFDVEKLRNIVMQLPNEYTIKIIDENIFNYCKNKEWCRDLVSQFSDWHQFKINGLGVIILKDGEVVSGASSYSAYLGGIEVEIDTKEEYRRKGLALICGARLICECLDRGLYPSWDAQNLCSVSLAEKLGYNFDYEYVAYEIYCNDIQ